MTGPSRGKIQSKQTQFALLLCLQVVGLTAHVGERATAALQPARNRNIARAPEDELGLLTAGEKTPKAAAEVVEGTFVVALTKDQYAFLDECEKEGSSLKKIRGYLSKGVPINVKDDRVRDYRDPQYGEGRTCLHWAVHNMNSDLVKVLLKKEANPNVQNAQGCTTLYFAAQMVADDLATEMAETLLQYKADPNIGNEHNETPLFVAVGENYRDLTRLLLQHAADPNIITSSGSSPLDQAVNVGENRGLDMTPVVMILLTHGASNAPLLGRTSRSLLCFLASHSQRDGIDMLLGNRTKYSVTSDDINDAVSCAYSSDIVHALMDEKAEATGDAAAKAATAGHWSAVGALLSRGAPMTSSVSEAAAKETKKQPSFIAQSIVDKAEANYTASHWAVRFCDAYAVSLHMSSNTDTEVVAKDNATPFSIATNQQTRCPGIHSILSSFKAAKENVAFAEANATEAKKQSAIANQRAQEVEDALERVELQRTFAEANATEATRQSISAQKNAEEAQQQKANAEDALIKLKAKEDQERTNKQIAEQIVGAIAVGVGSVGQLLQMFILNIDTIHKQKFGAQMVLPLIPALASGIMLKAGWLRLGSVAAVAAGVQLAIVAALALGGAHGATFRRRLQGVKRWGQLYEERIWLHVDSALHAILGVSMLVEQVFCPPPQRAVLLAGITDGVMAMVSSSNALPPRHVGMIFGVAALASMAFEVTDRTSDTRSNDWTEGLSPAFVVLTGTWLLIAFIHAPRVCSKLVVNLAKADGKFSAGELVMGQSATAAGGLQAAIGLTRDQIVQGERDGLEAIKKEIEATGFPEDADTLRYLIDGGEFPTKVQESLAAGVYHGGTIAEGEYDTGHAGKPLSWWMQRPEVKAAGLNEPEVVVTRLYSSSTYPRINGPLRKLMPQKPVATITPLAPSPRCSRLRRLCCRFRMTSRRAKARQEAPDEVELAVVHDGRFGEVVEVGEMPVEKHPLPMTVYHLESAIKKLRQVKAKADAEGFAKERVLWRGMQNRTVDIAYFKKYGGTELAPMSTTSDEEVARKYAASNVPLVFRYDVVGLRAGVEIQWCSLYPKEAEFLYPPLTFMSYKRHYEDDGQLVVVVEPAMP